MKGTETWQPASIQNKPNFMDRSRESYKTLISKSCHDTTSRATGNYFTAPSRRHRIVEVVHQNYRHSVILRQRHIDKRLLEPLRQNGMVHVHGQQQAFRRPKFKRCRDHGRKIDLLNCRHGDGAIDRSAVRGLSRGLMQCAAVVEV